MDLTLSYWRPYDERLGLEGQPEDPEQLASELRRAGRRIELIEADLERPSTPDRLIQESADRLGPLDPLVLSHCESVDWELVSQRAELASPGERTQCPF